MDKFDGLFSNGVGRIKHLQRKMIHDHRPCRGLLLCGPKPRNLPNCTHVRQILYLNDRRLYHSDEMTCFAATPIGRMRRLSTEHRDAT